MYFATGSDDKFEDAKSVFPDLMRYNLDLVEIQDIKPENILRAKLLDAMNTVSGELIVEDTALYMNCLKGMPGPLIKLFMETHGNFGLYDLADKLENYRARAETMIGYSNNGNMAFFSGSLEGKLVFPMGSGFGWDQIFQPDGFDKSFGEMEFEEKNEISMRIIALNKLKEYLIRK